MNKVMIHPADYNHCSEAVERAFDLFPVNIRNKRVLVKPNALRATAPETCVTTHPAVVRAIVDKLEQSGAAAIIVGDNPGMMSYGANEQTFEATGLREASKGYYKNIGIEAVTVPFNPGYIDQVSVSQAVLDADVVISVPKFKTHSLTILSGAIKNSYGYIPGALKAKLHRLSGNSVRFGEVLVDVFNLRVPDLIIMDAVQGMEGDGPASPDLRDIGLILVSDNAVALDAVVTRLMGFDPARIPVFEFAEKKGLGSYDEDSYVIEGVFKPIPHFKLPKTAQSMGEIPTGEGDFFESRIVLRPKVDKNLCTGCRTCVNQCPVSALSMNDEGFPEVNAEVCIACFCCQEMCPEMAIVLS
jgi:uncharacterized protein (DUF362 family)/Pyruvate/2-oxoacid:ferredoxin oxidoreductase delta subunit